MKRFFRDLLRSPWVQRALGVLAAEYLRLVWLTNRFGYDPANVYDLVEPEMPAIFVFWHGQHFITPFIKTKESYRAKVLISRHRDGEYNAIAAERLGIGTIRGSGDHSGAFHRKGGVGAFREMVQALEEGWNVATTADVPKRARVAGMGVIMLARESGRLEQRVTDEGHNDDPEALLEDLFEVGHQLLAIRTMATHSAETYRGMAKRIRSAPADERPIAADLADRFEMVRSMADGQKEFVHGVIEFYQTRTSTHMTIAAESLAQTSVQQNNDMRRITAWVAIIAVPTAVTGFFGQNLPYPGFGERAGFIASAVIMICAAVVLFAIFKTKRWL